MKITYKLNGQIVTRGEFCRKSKGLRKGQTPMVPSPGNWPCEQIGLGCPKSQVQEFREHAAKGGFTGVHFDDSGNCKVDSRSERRRYLKYRNLRDNDGGYSDG